MAGSTGHTERILASWCPGPRSVPVAGQELLQRFDVDQPRSDAGVSLPDAVILHQKKAWNGIAGVLLHQTIGREFGFDLGGERER